MDIDKNIIDLFHKVVNNNSNKIALKYKDKIYTYKDIDSISDSIAFHLMNLGLGGKTIGIYMDKSDEFIISILGVLKCNCVYVPLSKNNSMNRTEYMLEIIGIENIICNNNDITFSNINHYYYNDLIKSKESFNTCLNDVPKTGVAYIIFTSGSTGKPKGISIKHSSIINLVKSLDDVLFNRERNNYSQIGLLADILFDMSVGQLYVTLLTGRTLDIIPDTIKKSPRNLIEYINDRKIELCDITPSLMEITYEYIDNMQVHYQYPYMWNSSGEALPLPLAIRVLNYNRNCKIANSYGPAEACVYVTSFVIDKDNIKNLDKMHVGKVLQNNHIYIMNDTYELCDNNVEGEICIGGIGLSEGYVNQPELTKEKFITNPLIQDEIIYRTGDYGKFLMDGNLFYIGRKDDQVKIRGYRIELQEVEKAIERIPNILRCRVLVNQHETRKQLIAYILSDKELFLDDIILELKLWLPNYMIPAYFVPTKEFPTSVNGKLDRLKMPDYKIFALKGNSQTYSNDIDNEYVTEFIDIMKTVLDYENIACTDNFISIGGDSLSIMYLTAIIESRWGITLNEVILYECNTINDMIEYFLEVFGGAISNNQSKESTLKQVEASPFQVSILNAEEKATNKEYPTHNIVQLAVCDTYIESTQLLKAINMTVKRHDALRTTIIKEDCNTYLSLHKECNNYFKYIICTDLKEEYIKSFVKSFNVEELPLFQVILFEDKEKAQRILLNAHHSIFDYFSVYIFLSDILNFYYNENVPPLNSSYYDVILKEKCRNNKEIKQFYRHYFCGRKKAAYFPIKHGQTENKVKDNDIFFNQDFIIHGDFFTKLHKFCRNIRVTHYWFLMGALAFLLYQYTREDDITIGTFMPGRNHQEEGYMKHIGLFTTCIGIRMHINSNDRIRQFLQNVSNSFKEVMSNQNISLEELYTSIDFKDLMKGELFKFIFNYITQISVKVKTNDTYTRITSRDISLEPNSYPLSVTAYENFNSIRININYVERLYSCDIINKIILDYQKVILFFMSEEDNELSIFQL